jgi:hypothetical protein
VVDATVVAYYDALPADLAELVSRVQGWVGEELPGFRPRRLGQVHATIIGLGRPRPGLDLPGLLDHLRAAFAAPLRIQFGGFADRDYAFASRGGRLYERGLTLRNGTATLVGWPVGERRGGATAEAEPLDVLDGIRRGCRRFGAAHKYHDAPGATDPDAYLVVGGYDDDAPTSAAGIERAARRARAALLRHPVRVRTGVEQLRVVAYGDRGLPPASTVALPLAMPGVDGELLRLLARR